MAKNNEPTRLASGKVQRFVTPKVHQFWRSSVPAVINSGPADGGYALAPTLAFLGGGSDFTTLFEQYRIKKLRVTFTCTTFNTSADLPFPRIFIAPDYNDTAIDSAAAIMQREGVIVHEFTPTNPSITVEIEPKVAMLVFRTAVLSGYSAVPSCWLDASYSDIPHFGFKYYITDYNSTNTPTRRINSSVQALIETRCVV
jgi:hypothetical protein